MQLFYSVLHENISKYVSCTIVSMVYYLPYYTTIHLLNNTCKYNFNSMYDNFHLQFDILCDR